MKQQLIKFVSAFEGYIDGPYTDCIGIQTYYFGHVPKTSDDPVLLSEPYTREKGEELLWKDLQYALNGVKRLIHVPLNDNQLIALTSFSYNLGTACLQRSSLRQRLNRSEYQAAAQQFKRYDNAAGKVIPGLLHRRRAEAALFLTQQ